MVSETQKSVRVRFAPSPTGFLHIGGLRTALYNYLFARRHSGTFILRIEDTDQSRVVPGGVESIIRTLARVGLDHDEGPMQDGSERGEFGPYTQSKRLALYREHALKLVKSGAAYECFCTPDELEAARQIQITAKQPTLYNKRCKTLGSSDSAALTRAGRKSVIRLAVPEEGSIAFEDLIRGSISFENKLIDDCVLLKSDGFPTYHLANVVDDHLMRISHVVRGEEWIPSTPKHILLYRAFGWDAPAFAHLPLLLNADRSKLSKRQMDVAVEDYLEKGYLPETILNFVALLGWNPRADREVYHLPDLIPQFDLTSVNASGAVVNAEKLDWLNGLHIRHMPPAELVRRALPFFEHAGLLTAADGAFVNDATGIVYTHQDLESVISLEQERVRVLSELPDALAFVFTDKLTYEPQLLVWKKADAETARDRLERLVKFLSTAAGEWTASALETQIKQWIDGEGIGVGETLWPMRVALTGREASPGPFEVAAVLGRDRTLARLKIAVKKLS